MSWQAASWAADAEQTGKMPAAHRVILFTLANNADEDGKYSFPSVATLARRAGVDERNVRRSLRWLEDNGLIVKGDQNAAGRFRSDRRPTVYDLQIGGAPVSSREDDGGAPVSTTGGRTYPERGGAGAPRLIQEPSIDTNTVTADAVTTSPATGDGYGTLHLVDVPSKPDTMADFEAWWEVWPARKVGKAEARKAWPKATRKVTLDILTQGAIAYGNWIRATGTPLDKTKHPASWLNGERWEDNLTIPTVRASTFDPTDPWNR